MTVTEEEECIHGLDKRWCAICLHGLSEQYRHAQLAVVARFKAMYDGDCPGCDLPILVGQSIVKMSNDLYYHDYCEPECQ